MEKGTSTLNLKNEMGVSLKVLYVVLNDINEIYYVFLKQFLQYSFFAIRLLKWL